jgi:outer membrane protein assembly factor BamA
VVSDTAGAHSAELRAGLLFDTRDEEASPSRGILLEVMGGSGSGDFRYTRWLAGARAFIPLGEFEQWVIGLRQTVELAEGDIPVFVQYERATTWYPEDGFGGPTSLRLFAPGRFVAANRGVASVDVRKKLLDFPLRTGPMRAWALGFADAGRLWDQDARPSLRGLHWAAGIGGRLQFGKGTIFGLDLGLNGDDGFGFAFGTSFAF